MLRRLISFVQVLVKVDGVNLFDDCYISYLDVSELMFLFLHMIEVTKKKHYYACYDLVGIFVKFRFKKIHQKFVFMSLNCHDAMTSMIACNFEF